MQVTNYGAHVETLIVAAMSRDAVVAARFASKWKTGGLFGSKNANIAGGWCASHFLKYGEPLGDAWSGYFARWCERQSKRNADAAALLEAFIEGVRDAPPQVTDHVLDVATAHVNRIRLERLNEVIRGCIDTDDLAGAEKALADASPIQLAGTDGVDPLGDKSVIDDAFSESAEPLVTYPGALGEFFGNALERDALFAFLAPEKRGKTFWMLDLAWRALKQRLRVAFFQAGDLSQRQFMRRFATRLMGRPLTPKKIQMPTDIQRTQTDAMATVTSDEREYGETIDAAAAWAKCQTMLTDRLGGVTAPFRLVTYPNNSLNVSGIRGIVETWGRSGWRPDVIVIDYADILAPEPGAGEGRDSINTTWKELRSLSQSEHCLVVTATQADAQSYTTSTLARSNFSEDKRKLAHATAIAGINQTEDEKQFGIQRLNWIVLREQEYQAFRCVHVAGCLAIAQPAIKSCW